MSYTLEENLKKLEEIGNLEAGWDGYGHAVPTDRGVLENVKRLLEQMSIQPFIVPYIDGGVQAEWELENGDYFEVGCWPDNKYHVFVIFGKKHISKEFYWDDPDQDFDILDMWIEKFYRGVLDIELLV